MRDLRNMCEKAGVDVTHATVGEYTIGDEVCDMHLVMGKKK
jgi:hypothetical protein